MADSVCAYAVPAVPAGKDAVEITNAGALTVRLSALVADADPLSVTFTVKLNVPATPAVPDIVPPAFKLTPAGKLPDAMDQEYGGVPPVAESPCE